MCPCVRIESDVLWEVLCQSLPLWKGRGATETSGGKGEPQAQVRDEGEGGGEGGGEGEKVKMVTAQFASAANGKPLTRAKETMMVRVDTHNITLKQNKLYSLYRSLTSVQKCFPIVIMFVLFSFGERRVC